MSGLIRSVVDLFFVVVGGCALLFLGWAAMTHPWALLLVLAAFVSGAALGAGAAFVLIAIGLAEQKKKAADAKDAGGQGQPKSADSGEVNGKGLTPQGKPVDLATVLQVVQQYEDRCRKAITDLNAASRGLKASAWWN